MKIIKYLVIGCFVTLSTVSFAKQSSKDVVSKKLELTNDFQWVYFKGLSAPIPKDWNRFSKGDTYVSSVEDIKEEGIFETGLTIQTFKNVQEKYKAPASVAAISIVTDFKNDPNNKFLILEPKDIGDYKTILLRYENSPKVAEAIIVHKFIISNDKKSFVYVVTFESTKTKWDSYWKEKGEYIFKRINLYNEKN